MAHYCGLCFVILSFILALSFGVNPATATGCYSNNNKTAIAADVSRTSYYPGSRALESEVHSRQIRAVSSLEEQLKANLTELVQFVIHPTAKPSSELMSHALSAGNIPATEMERIVYLGILQRIARNTPELVKRFTSLTTNLDGTQTKSVDNIGLDTYVTMNALKYVQAQQTTKAARNTLSSVINTSSAASSAKNALAI